MHQHRCYLSACRRDRHAGDQFDFDYAWDAYPNILYVVTAVEFPDSNHTLAYYVHAIDITVGQEASANSPHQITATAHGIPTSDTYPTTCGVGTGSQNDMVTFGARCHLQRTGLLLVTTNYNQVSYDNLYIGFAPVCGERQNGWILGYRYNPNDGSWTQMDPFVTTPYGTGGGVWQSGAGLASDGANIYVAVGNGTFDIGQSPRSLDYGDSVLKLAINSLTGNLTVDQYFAPADVLSYTVSGQQGQGRCHFDVDVGSAGVMLFPNAFYAGYDHLMITADKESTLYVINRDDLTGFHPSGNTIVETITTPLVNGVLQPGQGYWGSPAYWEWGSGSPTRAIYYSVDATTDEPENRINIPRPINMYILQTSGPPGPIPSATPSSSTSTAFCGHGGAPVISANGSTPGTGILWAVEASNTNNPNPGNCEGTFGSAVLHAYDASNVANSLFASKLSYQNNVSVGGPSNFATPMVFNHRVYMATRTKVNVFGLCSQSLPCMQ